MTLAAEEPGDDGAARHLVRGLAMPDIQLPLTSEGTINFAQVQDWCVVYFYPWTGRPGHSDPPQWDWIPGAHGSTPQAESFRNLHAAFVEIGAAIFGVSGQDTEWQSEFTRRLQLPFPLASDADARLRDSLRLPTFETGGVTYLKRLTLVLRNARIERVFYPVHAPATHPRELLAWLDERATRRN